DGRRGTGGARARRDETARTDTRAGLRCRTPWVLQENFRNTPAFSKDATDRPILPSRLRGSKPRGGHDNAETASRPDVLRVADNGDAGAGGDTCVRGAAQSRSDRERRLGCAGRQSRV